MSPCLIALHSGIGSIAEPTRLPKPCLQSKDSNFLVIPSKNPTQISTSHVDLHSGLVDWASLPKDILVLIAECIDFFEDFFNFCLACKSWQSASSLCGKRSRTLPPRCPWVMLTDIAEMNFPKVTKDMSFTDMLVEEIEKNEHVEGMNKRQFFSFSRSKTYEFELPEATHKKCLGVGNGWLMTIGYDLKINLLHPFSRQQVGLPPFLSFKDQYQYTAVNKPQFVICFFIWKAVMSSNPYNSSNEEDCIILAIYGQFKLLAFARPGDKVWTDIYPRYKFYRDVIYYKGKFYALDLGGVVVVCDFDNVKRPTAKPIACIPKGLHGSNSKYLVESSGSLLVVVRFRKEPPSWKDSDYMDDLEDDLEDDTGDDIGDDTGDDIEDDTGDDTGDDIEDDTGDDIDDDTGDDIEDDEQLEYYTVRFSVFKLEEFYGDGNSDANNYKLLEDDNGGYEELPMGDELYPNYKLMPVNNLGDKSLFVGLNASVSVPCSCSNNIKANHIYFSDDEPINYGGQPHGGGRDTGIYDMESGSIILHQASKFKSHLTPPMWYI